MLRSVVFGGVLVFVISACAAEANMSASTKSGVNGSASASSNDDPPQAPAAAAASPPPAETAPAPAPTGPATLPGCAMVCVNAHPRTRLTPDAEAKVTSAVTSEMQQLHTCTGGGPAPSLTLRFDSAGELTEFGVDDEHARSYTNGTRGCVDQVRTHRPSLSYPGPATLRCSERCGRGAATAKR